MSTLALKLFRREPAISKFVWSIATHKSSRHFQRAPGSVSIASYRTFNLLMGRSHGFGSDMILRRRSSVSTAAPSLQQPRIISTRRFILQKSTLPPINRLETCCRHTVSGSISLPLPGCFSPSLGTGSLSVFIPLLHLICVLLGWVDSQIQTRFSIIAVLRILFRCKRDYF